MGRADRDTLFIGDVGRPDFFSSTGWTADDLARRLYTSLHTQLLTLPDSTRLYPAHGAGSACGKAMSDAVSSTIGEQRRTNYAVQPMTEDAFVAAVTEGQSVAPLYFAFTAESNRRAHDLLDVVVADPGREAEAKVRLARIGFDHVVGTILDIERVLVQRPDLATTSTRIGAMELSSWITAMTDLQIVDVRNPGEQEAGTIPGAIRIPLARLLDRHRELDADATTIVYCAGGYRSSIASLLLRSLAFERVADLQGGFAAWETAVRSPTTAR